MLRWERSEGIRAVASEASHMDQRAYVILR
jgi:hypothetical protein